MRRAPLLLLLPLLAVALVSFVFVRIEQGSGGAFELAQRSAEALTPASVDRVVRVAPDPVTKAKGIRAVCKPLGRGELRNPWRCVIDYASGRQISYQVNINLTGRYVGTHEIVRYQGQTYSDTGEITGCCVVVP